MTMIRKIFVSITLSVALLATTATAGVYTVKKGDTIAAIAKELGFKSVKEMDVIVVPSGDTSMLRVGDQIVYKGSITEESLGLRKTSLYSEGGKTKGDKTSYGDGDVGTGYKINRSFQDAPPLIPHTVEGMYPITMDENLCLTCHMPDVAAEMNATAIPASHLTNFRPKHKLRGKKFSIKADVMKNEVAIKKMKKLSNARYGCSQCHVPQSVGKLPVENTFKAIYSDEDGISKSRWSGSRLTDNLDTLGSNSLVTEDDLNNASSASGSLK